MVQNYTYTTYNGILRGRGEGRIRMNIREMDGGRGKEMETDKRKETKMDKGTDKMDRERRTETVLTKTGTPS